MSFHTKFPSLNKKIANIIGCGFFIIVFLLFTIFKCFLKLSSLIQPSSTSASPIYCWIIGLSLTNTHGVCLTFPRCRKAGKMWQFYKLYAARRIFLYSNLFNFNTRKCSKFWQLIGFWLSILCSISFSPGVARP